MNKHLKYFTVACIPALLFLVNNAQAQGDPVTLTAPSLPTTMFSGATYGPYTYSLVNHIGTANVYLSPGSSPITVTGNIASISTLTNNCPFDRGAYYVPAAGCNFTVAFNPIATGTTNGQVNVSFKGATIQPDIASLIPNITVGFAVTPIVEPQGCTSCMGSMSPGIAQAVVSGNSIPFTLTPTGTAVFSGTSGTCGGTLSSSTFTTNAITQACSVFAAFINETAIPTAGSGSSIIVLGPDNNSVWFTETTSNKIARVVGHNINEYDVNADSSPRGITVGPDGNLWFTEVTADKIGVMNTNGVVLHEYSVGPGPFSITVGSDGNLWFTEFTNNKIGVMDKNGNLLNEYTIQTANSGPREITLGADGSLWFTEFNGNKIGTITTGGDISEYSTGLSSNSQPFGITKGPDGNVWFVENGGNNIGKITSSGSITEYPIPTVNSRPYGITVGPDNNLWFTQNNNTGITNIGKIIINGNLVTMTEYPIPTVNSAPRGIAKGPDANIWFVESGANKIGTL
jgi:virginiamycin B lyase